MAGAYAFFCHSFQRTPNAPNASIPLTFHFPTWIRTVAAVERRPQRGWCNRRLSGLGSDVRKLVFRHNRYTSTSICASRQQPSADKSPETPPTERIPQRAQKKDDLKKVVLISSTINFFPTTGFERRQKPRGDQEVNEWAENRRFR